MKKFLLSLMVTVLVLAASAQGKHMAPNPHKEGYKEQPVVLTHTQSYSPVTHQHRSSRGEVSFTKLHSERVGSAGNLLTVLEGTCNQIDVNDQLNLVTFIHRNDNSVFGGSLAQYRFDVSHDRGNNWTSDLGTITNNPVLDNTTAGAPKARFPQAGIFNPSGNTIPDSAYLIYSGTYHNDDHWIGQARGRGKISGDTSTFNVNLNPITSASYVAIASGFCHGAPGVFWNLNREYNGGFVTGDPQVTTGLIVEKGVWNTGTKDVDWTQQTIPQTFVHALSGTTDFTVVYSTNIAFDPTGQYGWISALADITPDLDSVLDPIFWKSTDFGATWSGPIRVDLDSLPEVMAQLGQINEVSGDPSSGVPTGWGDDGDLVVDAWGNPHFLTLVGSGTGYGIEFAGFDMWDITFNANNPVCQGGWHGWHGLYLDSLHTLQGDMTSDNPAYTESNRPMASATADGKRLFFFWTESDAAWVGSNDNVLPNLFGKGVDPEHYLFTKTVNFTEGDSLWGGETSNTSGGAFGGAKYGTASPVALVNGDTYNVPVVLTQIDYNFDLTQGLGSSDQPAAFWYINNINFEKGSFTEGLAADVEINGLSPVTINAGNGYTEDGANLTYLDTTCYHSGLLHLVIDTGNLNTNAAGTYIIYYYAEDDNGNIYAADSRTVIVGAIPTAEFTWSFPGPQPNKVQFQDQSTNIPTSWVWNFGDGSGSNLQNPQHIFATAGTYHVCLTVTNGFGTSQTVCHDILITSTGINTIAFEQNITMFPNPSTGKVMLTVNGNSSPEFTVTVYNVLGETVVSSSKYKAGTTNVELNLTNAPSGLYLVKIQSNEGTAVKHLTIDQK